jgi:hypothetical protein
MKIEIKLDSVLSRYGDHLAGVGEKLPRALREGLQEGGNKVATKVRRALREQTGVTKYGTILSRTHAGLGSGGELAYVIRGQGKGLPIGNFRVGVNAKGVLAFPWGKAHLFKRSFKTSSKGMLRARLGASRMPIRAFFGPSIAKELTKDHSAAAFEAGVRAEVEPIIIKRLGRLLPR